MYVSTLPVIHRHLLLEHENNYKGDDNHSLH
jgi:hypothetical protein